MTVYPTKFMSASKSKHLTDIMLMLHEIKAFEPVPQCFIKRIMKNKWGFSTRKINRLLYMLANSKVCRKTGEMMPAVIKIDAFGRLVVA